MHRVGVPTPPEPTIGTELRIQAASLTPLRGTVCDGEEAMPFQGWLQLLAWLESRLDATAAADETSGNG